MVLDESDREVVWLLQVLLAMPVDLFGESEDAKSAHDSLKGLLHSGVVQSQTHDNHKTPNIANHLPSDLREILDGLDKPTMRRLLIELICRLRIR